MELSYPLLLFLHNGMVGMEILFFQKKELTCHLLHMKYCLGPLSQSYLNNVMLPLIINLKPFEGWFADH